VEVQTVTGPVDSAELGFTLMHEHVVSADPEILATRCETVAALAARGYAAQMVLSHDTHCFCLSWDRGVRDIFSRCGGY
jgi:predicted metal-dependent phosphotriesterase family hydrolase